MSDNKLSPALIAKINDTAKTLCQKHEAWNVTTATEFFVTVLDEYLASTEQPDAADLAPVFKRYANLNDVGNRFAKQGWIIREKKADKKADIGGLV